MRDAEIARASSARLLAAACRGQGAKWTRQEILHEQATSSALAAAAADPLLQQCSSCPIVAECRIWACLDEYTGIAAGTAWREGEERHPSWVPGHPPRGDRLLLAS